MGELPQYYVHECHPAIIDRNTFQRVQEELSLPTLEAKIRSLRERQMELEQTAGAITEFDEITVRQLVSYIKKVSEDTLLICSKDRTEITQIMENTGRVST